MWGVISGIDFSSVDGQGHMHVGGNDLGYQGIISLYIVATFAMNDLMNCVH